jgi:hypothetical protein
MEAYKRKIEELESDMEMIQIKIQRLKLELQQKKQEIKKLSSLKEKNNFNDLTNVDDDLYEYLHVPVYNIGNYRLEINSRNVFFEGSKIATLTKKELDVLVVFAANINKFVERKFFLNVIWNQITPQASRSMDVYICKLRKMLADDSRIHIHNHHGEGFMMIVSA